MLPVKEDGEIDHQLIEKNLNCDIKSILPKSKKTKNLEKLL